MCAVVRVQLVWPAGVVGMQRELQANVFLGYLKGSAARILNLRISNGLIILGTKMKQ